MRVFARVLVWGTVTAQRHAALLARSQMNPARTDLNTLGAFANLRLLHRLNRIEMRTTSFRHNYSELLVETNRS